MLQALKVLKQSLAYATFSDATVEKTAKALITGLGKELHEEGYEPSDTVETQVSELTDAIDNVDSSVEDINAAIQGADDNDDDDDEDEE